MNTKEFAFIICVNNMQYYEECMRYIRDLKIPDGYGVDIICIQDVRSMTSGYNAGMRKSEAKYKIYLHQDTFILNENFLYDILDIFISDESIGMIGMLGAKELPDHAKCYLSWNVGTAYAYNGIFVCKINLYQDKSRGYLPVKAIDGMIMITQTDIPWREDILDGWDFYDVSQSLEMDRQGYQVVVPYQKKPWCHHDCGINSMEKYDFYRLKMIKEYSNHFIEEAGDKSLEEVWREQKDAIELRQGLIKLFSIGEFKELLEVTEQIRKLKVKDTQVRELVKLMEIYALETEKGEYSEWWDMDDWTQVYENYKYIRFVLMRMFYEKEDERRMFIQKFMNERKLSEIAVKKIISYFFREEEL